MSSPTTPQVHSMHLHTRGHLRVSVAKTAAEAPGKSRLAMALEMEACAKGRKHPFSTAVNRFNSGQWRHQRRLK